MRLISIFTAAMLALPVLGVERVFDFGDYALDHSPTGFTSMVVGRGKPGDWKILLDEVPPALAPLTAKAPTVSRRAVLAQKAREPLNVHFPMLLFDEETFRDFKFTTRFKLVGGALDQSAGIVFRFVNESNFFLVRASGLSGSFRCSKVVDGEMKPSIGSDLPITKDVWHEMSLACEGTRITGTLDGVEAIKLIDNAASGTVGKIGFCTKSDAVTYFADAKVIFTPREILAQKITRATLKEYSRLVGLKIYATKPGEKQPVVVASTNQKDLGQPSGQMEQDVIEHGKKYYGKGRETVTVVLPLRDNNGEPMAAVCLEMKSFIGQTEDNALVRAQPIIKMLQSQVHSLEDLLQ